MKRRVFIGNTLSAPLFGLSFFDMVSPHIVEVNETTHTVYYVPVGNVSSEEARTIVQEFADTVKNKRVSTAPKDTFVATYIMPAHNIKKVDKIDYENCIRL